MKNIVLFNPGEDPIELDQYDPQLAKRDAYFYSSRTGNWYISAGTVNNFPMPASNVPKEYQAWILVL